MQSDALAILANNSAGAVPPGVSAFNEWSNGAQAQRWRKGAAR